MHQLDLSTLSGPELRSLLDSARDRGQAAQSYEILQEMARRRDDGGPKRGLGRRRREAGEPRIITLDLGDPLEPDEDPFEPPPPPDLDAPLTLAPAPEAAPPPRAPKPGRRMPAGALGFALGALAGIVLGVGLGGSVAEALFPPPDVELAQAVQLPPPPPPLPPAEPPPVPAAAPEPPVIEAVATEPLAAVAPSADTAEMTADAATPAETSDAPEGPPTACASEPTAADRAICEDAELQRLQRDLRRSYAEALAAHEERALLRQRQLAWREARNTIADPERLAGMYEARIRKLKAATAAARAAH